MKFRIKRLSLIDGLNKISRAISKQTTMPILEGVRIKASSDQKLSLTGSNADISIRTVISATSKNHLRVIDDGAVVLKARFFTQIAKKLPEDMIAVSVGDNFQATIKSGNSVFKINGLDASNFPHLPKIGSGKSVKLSGDLFKKIIRQTVIAVSDQESRPILTGVHFTLANSQLLAVATDSHRLSQRKVALSNNPAECDVIIPGASLLELSRMIDRHSRIEMRLSPNQVLFIMGDTFFYSRLLEGNYPETEQLIPRSASTEVQFDAPKLLSAIERASLLSHASNNNVIKMTLNPAQNAATITGDSPDVGDVEEDLTPKSIGGKQLAISFNPDYVKDALRSLGETVVKIKFLSPLQPFTMLPTQDKHNCFIQLITPVRTF